MHADTSDMALHRAWQQHRDAEAFHEIVGRHARLVYNTCRNVLRNDDDAAEVSSGSMPTVHGGSMTRRQAIVGLGEQQEEPAKDQ